MKFILPIIVAAICVSCGENRQERTQREEAERNRRTVLELQRQDNIQRAADRDQRTFETIIGGAVRGAEVITR